MTDPAALEADVTRAIQAQPGALVVACSGGVDSVALADLVGRVAPERTELVYVEHGWSDAGAHMADVVAQLGARLGCPTRCLPLLAPPDGPMGAGVEGNARAQRYATLAAATPGATILTAHTLDDHVETLVMRLARGTGIHGLVGIQPRAHVHGAKVWRPVLSHRRATLREYAITRSLAWVDDPTNRDLERTRNRARHHVIPALQTLGSDAAIARTARVLQADAQAYRWWVERELAALRWPHHGPPHATECALDARALAALPPYVLRALLHAASVNIGAPASEAATARIAALVSAKPGANALGNGLRAERGWWTLRLAAVEDPRVPLAHALGPDAAPIDVDAPTCVDEWVARQLPADGGDTPLLPGEHTLVMPVVRGRLLLRRAHADEPLRDGAGRTHPCGVWARGIARAPWRDEHLVAIADDEGVLALLGCRHGEQRTRIAEGEPSVRLRVGPRHSVLAFAADRPTFAR